MCKCIVILLLTAGRDYTMVSREIKFFSRQSKVIINIPILDDSVPQELDIYFFVDITFNTGSIARSIVTISDNDHGKLK